MITNRTKFANKQTVERQWFILDMENVTLGRAITKVATVLRGKHKASYTPHCDCGDNVIIINADKVRLTGAKWDQKEYITFSGYPGGQKRKTARLMNAQFPERVVENAVRGMLPKNRLGRAMYKKLFVYAGAEHPHQAQKPQKLEL